MKQTFKVQTRHITIYDRRGVRLSRAGDNTGVATDREWFTWAKGASTAANIREAIRHVINKCRHEHIGGIVVIRQVINGISSADETKIFQAKWGTDGRPFVRWEPNPVSAYWRGKVLEAIKISKAKN